MPPDVAADLYRRARRAAAVGLHKHGKHEAAPASCTYRFERIVTQDWYPASRHGLTDVAPEN